MQEDLAGNLGATQMKIAGWTIRNFQRSRAESWRKKHHHKKT
jgi:hypothetical protein